MDLLDGPIPERIRRTFRRSRVRGLLSLLTYGAILTLAVWFVHLATDGLTRWNLGLLAPFALVLLGIVLCYLPEAVRTTALLFRSSNWLLKVGDEALYLNPRSFRNPVDPSGSPTAVRIGFDELEGLGSVTIRTDVDVMDVDPEGDRRKETRRYLELHLKAGDTRELEPLLRDDLSRIPKTRRVGVGVVFKHQPLKVSGPDRLLVEELPGMLPALERRLRVAPASRREETASHESYA